MQCAVGCYGGDMPSVSAAIARNMRLCIFQYHHHAASRTQRDVRSLGSLIVISSSRRRGIKAFRKINNAIKCKYGERRSGGGEISAGVVLF